MRLQSTLTLQSYIRSYLVRKHKKQEERVLFDQGDCNNIVEQLGKFLFFYEARSDKERFVCIEINIATTITNNWFSRCILVLH